MTPLKATLFAHSAWQLLPILDLQNVCPMVHLLTVQFFHKTCYVQSNLKQLRITDVVIESTYK